MRITGDGKKLIDSIADEYLAGVSLTEAKKAIALYVKVPLTHNQYAAVTSYIKRCGISTFRKSKLLKTINLSARHWSHMVKAADHFFDQIYLVDKRGKRWIDEYLIFHSKWERDTFLMPETVPKRKR